MDLKLREKASINDCRRLAEQSACDGAYFDLVGPTGRIRAKWLDAYMGLLRIEGESGFCKASDFDRPDIYCENFALAISADAERAA
jgi:hypothetical protein